MRELHGRSGGEARPAWILRRRGMDSSSGPCEKIILSKFGINSLTAAGWLKLWEEIAEGRTDAPEINFEAMERH